MSQLDRGGGALTKATPTPKDKGRSSNVDYDRMPLVDEADQDQLQRKLDFSDEAESATASPESSQHSADGSSVGAPSKRRLTRKAQTTGMTERQQLALVKKKTEEEALLLNIKKRNASGETPLHQMVIKGNKSMVSRLLERNATVNTKDYAGWTPLHEACNHGHIEIAALLLKNGAKVNQRGCDGDTALHDAAVNHHVEVVTLLLEAGASVTAENKHKKTPLDVASNPEVIALLKAAGAGVSPGQAEARAESVKSPRRSTSVSNSPKVARPAQPKRAPTRAPPGQRARKISRPATAPTIKPIEDPVTSRRTVSGLSQKRSAPRLPPGHENYSIVRMDPADNPTDRQPQIMQPPAALPEDCRALFLEHADTRFAMTARLTAEVDQLRATYERDMVRVFAATTGQLVEVEGDADSSIETWFPDDVYARYADEAKATRQRHLCETDALYATQSLHWTAERVMFMDLLPQVSVPRCELIRD